MTTENTMTTLWYYNIVTSDDKFIFVMDGGRDYQSLKEKKDALGRNYYIMKVETIHKSDKVVKVHKDYSSPKDVDMNDFTKIDEQRLYRFNAVCYNGDNDICVFMGFNIFKSCRRYIDSNMELALFTMKDMTLKERIEQKKQIYIHKEYNEKEELDFDMDDFF